MNVKQLLENEVIKKAALLLAEKRLQLLQTPGDDIGFAQAVGMTQMVYEIVDNDYALKSLYDYYCHKLDQPLPKPGETVLYYDPLDDHQPKPAKVVESRDSMTLDRPKLVKCECDDQVLELQDQHIYLLLYWNERS